MDDMRFSKMNNEAIYAAGASKTPKPMPPTRVNSISKLEQDTMSVGKSKPFLPPRKSSCVENISTYATLPKNRNQNRAELNCAIFKLNEKNLNITANFANNSSSSASPSSSQTSSNSSGTISPSSTSSSSNSNNYLPNEIQDDNQQLISNLNFYKNKISRLNSLAW